MTDHVNRPEAIDPCAAGSELPLGVSQESPKPIIATASFNDGQNFLGVLRTPQGCLPCEANSFEELLVKLALCVKQNRQWLAKEGYDLAGPRRVVFHDYLSAEGDEGRCVVMVGARGRGHYAAEGTLDGVSLRTEGDTFEDLVQHVRAVVGQAMSGDRPRIRLCLEAAF